MQLGQAAHPRQEHQPCQHPSPDTPRNKAARASREAARQLRPAPGTGVVTKATQSGSELHLPASCSGVWVSTHCCSEGLRHGWAEGGGGALQRGHAHRSSRRPAQATSVAGTPRPALPRTLHLQLATATSQLPDQSLNSHDRLWAFEAAISKHEPPWQRAVARQLRAGDRKRRARSQRHAGAFGQQGRRPAAAERVTVGRKASTTGTRTWHVQQVQGTSVDAARGMCGERVQQRGTQARNVARTSRHPAQPSLGAAARLQRQCHRMQFSSPFPQHSTAQHSSRGVHMGMLLSDASQSAAEDSHCAWLKLTEKLP